MSLEKSAGGSQCSVHIVEIKSSNRENLGQEKGSPDSTDMDDLMRVHTLASLDGSI